MIFLQPSNFKYHFESKKSFQVNSGSFTRDGTPMGLTYILWIIRPFWTCSKRPRKWKQLDELRWINTSTVPRKFAFFQDQRRSEFGILTHCTLLNWRFFCPSKPETFNSILLYKFVKFAVIKKCFFLIFSFDVLIFSNFDVIFRFE